LVENNLYGMGTAIERHSAVTDLSRRADGLGVPGVRVDGMDVLAVRETVAEHIRIAREDRQPTLVEAFTYRYRGHSAADPEVYRSKEEVEEWRQKDPVKVFRDRLLADGVISESEVEELRERLERRVMEAVEFADSSPEPPLDEAFTYRYRGHSAADPEVYRSKEEDEEWRQKDPVKVFRDRLLADGVISESEVEELRERLERRVMEAVEFADSSPEPPLESLYDHLYVVGDQVRGWYAVDERTPEPHRGEEEREVGAGGEARKLAEAGAAYAGQP